MASFLEFIVNDSERFWKFSDLPFFSIPLQDWVENKQEPQATNRILSTGTGYAGYYGKMDAKDQIHTAGMIYRYKCVLRTTE